MKKIFKKSSVTAITLFFLNTPFLFAQPGSMMGSDSHHPRMKEHSQKSVDHGQDKMAMGHGMKSHGGGHLFGDSWKSTLDDDQKGKIDKLHLELKKKIKPLSASLEVKNAELNNLVTEDKANIQAIKAKIKEILDVKQLIMEQKYSHKIDMRNILTEGQKVSFDLDIVSDSEKKMHEGH